MKVLNFIINDKNSFTEDLIKDMYTKNIDFLLIRNKEYDEIHFYDSIVRYGSDGYFDEILHDMNFMAKVEELERDCVNDPFNDEMHRYMTERFNLKGKVLTK